MAAIHGIKQRVPKADIEFEKLDLTSLQSVRKCVAR